MPDLYQFIDDIDADKQAMVVKRLEDRAQMPKFAEIRENYFDKIGLPLTGRILELGCGTGPVCRAIASRPGFVGTVVGSDLSAKLIDTAKDITAKSGLKILNISRRMAKAATPIMDSSIWCWRTLLSATSQILLLSGARPSVSQGQAARSSFTTAIMHPLHLTPIHLSSTERCLDSFFRWPTKMSCARFPAFSATRVSKLLMRLAMSCLKSALENSSQALRKISAPLQSGPESCCKPNSITGLKRSTVHYPKTRSSHHVIM
jgi:hypothetical protein